MVLAEAVARHVATPEMSQTSQAHAHNRGMDISRNNDLWHRRLAHASNRIIRDTIKCAIGLESLKKMTFETHVKCLSCMIGKATLGRLPEIQTSDQQATLPSTDGFIVIIRQIY
jgi:hypothetical protein